MKKMKRQHFRTNKLYTLLEFSKITNANRNFFLSKRKCKLQYGLFVVLVPVSRVNMYTEK